LVGPIHGLEEEIRALNSSAADLSKEIVKQAQQKERLTDEIALIRQEWEMLEEELSRIERQARNAEKPRRRSSAEQLARKWRWRRRSEATMPRTRTAAEQTARSARGDDAAQSLREANEKLDADLERGRIELDRGRRHEGILVARQADLELACLRAGAKLAEMFAFKESWERQIVESTNRRLTDRARRAELIDMLSNSRTESQQLVGQVHALELAARDLESARDRIGERLREDYQLDIAVEYTSSPLACDEQSTDDWDIPIANREVEELRRKIRNLGNVSLESLEELAEVENRATTLQGQINDLTEAEQSLRAVIARSTRTARSLQETYESIRAHFQELSASHSAAEWPM
jgi:chromosome segregation protein